MAFDVGIFVVVLMYEDGQPREWRHSRRSTPADRGRFISSLGQTLARKKSDMMT